MAGVALRLGRRAARHRGAVARHWFRRQWTWRSTRTRPGRPSTDATVRTLVGKMAAANPLWGAPRIHGELSKLGIAVSERTVSRLLRRPRRPSSQTWRTFLTNHVATLVSMDFFTVPTLTGRVLFVLVVLAHQRRRIIHVNITEHPTAAWTAQQVVDAFPDDTAPQWLLQGSRRHLRGRVPAPSRRHGHRRGHLKSVQPMAKSVRGTPDRFNQAGMSRPCDRARRAAFAASVDPLRHLLS